MLAACAAASGCRERPAPGVGAPAIGHELRYQGELALDLSSPEEPVLLTRAVLELTARHAPLERLELVPGLRELGLRPELGPDAWDWSLVALHSDRPLALTAEDERLGLVLVRALAPGERWRVELELQSPVAALAADARLGDLGPELASLEGLLEVGEQLVARFSKDAATTSFVEAGFHVLLPPWPLPLDCAGRSPGETFPPLDCVARHLLPAEVRVEVPAGWEAILPTPPVWELPPEGPRVARVERLPTVLVLAPGVAWQTVEVGGRRVGLCAPPARAGALPELGRLVAELLPRLEAALGPYPGADPVVCLSPTPLELLGLARGRLALIDMEVFPGGGSEGGREEDGLDPRLAAWLRHSAYFQALREELVLHELAHHWWRAELPERWERLFGEGVASLVARELALAASEDEERRYFARASPWLEAAQLELAGLTLPPLSALVARGPLPAGPAEGLLPYLHGLGLMERLLEDGRGGLRWEALRRLHREAPALAHGPEHLFQGDPVSRARLQEALAGDQRLSGLGRVDPIEHSMRCARGLLEALAEDEVASPALEALRREPGTLRGLFRARLVERLGAGLDPEQAGWSRIGEVLRLAGRAGCVAPPGDPAARQACLAELQGAGLGTLGGLVDLAEPAVWRSLEAGPEAGELLFERPRSGQALGEKARALLANPVRVDDAQAEELGETLSLAEARVERLFLELQARWAARAVLELFPEEAAPGGSAARNQPATRRGARPGEAP
jgi:hypothetical protein